MSSTLHNCLYKNGYFYGIKKFITDLNFIFLNLQKYSIIVIVFAIPTEFIIFFNMKGIVFDKLTYLITFYFISKLYFMHMSFYDFGNVRKQSNMERIVI